jgi:hypothetical protein
MEYGNPLIAALYLCVRVCGEREREGGREGGRGWRERVTDKEGKRKRKRETSFDGEEIPSAMRDAGSGCRISGFGSRVSG